MCRFIDHSAQDYYSEPVTLLFRSRNTQYLLVIFINWVFYTSAICLLSKFHSVCLGFSFQSANWFSLTFFPRHRCLHPSYLRTRICVCFLFPLLILWHTRHMKQEKANHPASQTSSLYIVMVLWQAQTRVVLL